MTIALLGLKIKVKGEGQTSKCRSRVETRSVGPPSSPSVKDSFLVWRLWGALLCEQQYSDWRCIERGQIGYCSRKSIRRQTVKFVSILANTRSLEAPAAADIHLHVSSRPASASVCMCTAGEWTRPPIRVGRSSAIMPAHLQHRQPGMLWLIWQITSVQTSHSVVFFL